MLIIASINLHLRSMFLMQTISQSFSIRWVLGTKLIMNQQRLEKALFSLRSSIPCTKHLTAVCWWESINYKIALVRIRSASFVHEINYLHMGGRWKLEIFYSRVVAFNSSSVIIRNSSCGYFWSNVYKTSARSSVCSDLICATHLTRWKLEQAMRNISCCGRIKSPANIYLFAKRHTGIASQYFQLLCPTLVNLKLKSS